MIEDHHVRRFLHPLSARRFGRERVHIAWRRAALQHLTETNLAFRWLCLVHLAITHSKPFASTQSGSLAGVVGSSGMQVKLLLPLRSVLTFPLASLAGLLPDNLY